MKSTTNTGLLIVDVQGNLAKQVYDSEKVISSTVTLIQCCKLLDIPIVVVEQYPQGLGATVPEIATLVEDTPHFAKMHFSALGEMHIADYFATTALTHWLVVGIEAHVCVYQTVMALLDKAFVVEVVRECISSRELSNKELAVSVLQKAGASITSVEMCIFELMKTCEHPNFKAVLALLK